MGLKGKITKRRVVVGIVVLEFLYLLAGNVFLSSRLGHSVLEPSSGKWSVDWESGWTVLPGLIRIHGVEVVWSQRRSEGHVEVDHGTVWMALPSLALRHVNFFWMDLEGAEVEVFSFPDPETPRPHRKGRGWKTTLGGLDVRDLRRLDIPPFFWDGAGALQGKVAFQGRGPFSLDLDLLEMVSRENATNGREAKPQGYLLARQLRFGPFTFGGGRLEDGLKTLDGHLELVTQSESEILLDYYLSSHEWLDVDGPGTLSLSVDLEDGVLQSGSRLALESPELAIRYFDFRMAGQGEARGSVGQDGAVSLEAELDTFNVALDEVPGVVSGDRFLAEIRSETSSLLAPISDLAVDVELSSAVVPDVTVFVPYIPPAAGVTVSRGTAEVSADISYHSGEKRGSGLVTLTGQDLQGSFSDLAVDFDLGLKLVLSEADFEAGKVELSGTEVAVSRLSGRVSDSTSGETTSVSDWWANVRVLEGTVSQPEVETGRRLPAVEARLEADLRDSSLVLDLLTRRVKKLAWFRSFLGVQDVRAGAEIDVHSSTFGLRELEILGAEKIELRAELDSEGGERKGLIFARYAKLKAALALGLSENTRDWKLIRPLEWYGEKKLEFRGTD